MIWKEKGNSRTRDVQLDNIRDLLEIRRIDKVLIVELCRVAKGGGTKGFMKAFSEFSAMWREWRETGLLRGSM